MGAKAMRTTWDALAAAPDLYVGDPGSGRQELDALLGRLGADPRGGTCVEVGCGVGRMTAHLAERFDRVIGLDVSPAMIAQAREALGRARWSNVEFAVVSGERLDTVADETADAVVCYLVLQHLPRRELVLGYFREFARVLAKDGEAFVHVPVYRAGLFPRAWRRAREVLVPVTSVGSGPARGRSYRGTRLTEAGLARGLEAAGLRVLARADAPSEFRFARDVFLRLSRP